MTLFPRLLNSTRTAEEIAVDLFAGGGGASLGYEMATGRHVDIAINHNAAAVGMHALNHPETQHYQSDVFEVDPRVAVGRRKVGLLWLSPDCTGFSKAKGAAPKRERDRKRRALAWVALRWIGCLPINQRPRVLMLENVEEFTQWTRLVGRPESYRECKKSRGRRFKRFIRLIRERGYTVEWRILRACDFGAATIRKRLFLIARCDGVPIVWPTPTHGDPNAPGFAESGLLPWDVAANHIQWNLPMCSVFATREEARTWAKFHGQACPQRPLKPKSMDRIGRGCVRYVVNNPNRYLRVIDNDSGCSWVYSTTHVGANRARSVDDPLTTITGAHRGEVAVAAAFATHANTGHTPNSAADSPLHTVVADGARHSVVAGFATPRYGEREGQAPRARSVAEPLPTVVPDGNGAQLVGVNLMGYHDSKRGEDRGRALESPLPTQDTSNRFALIASLLGQNNGGFVEGAAGDGRPITEPTGTITGKGANHSLISAHIARDFGTGTGARVDSPVGTLCGDGGHAQLVASFLSKYFGTGTGSIVDDPLPTATARDRFGLVSIEIGGEPWVIYDIGMRMLTPRELFRCQGFPDTYIIDRTADGRPLSKTEQVRLVGNSVCPHVVSAMIAANVPEMVLRKAA